MSRTRQPFRGTAVLAGSALLVSAPMAPSAFAATAPLSTIQITGLTDGQTVSGALDITAVVTPAPGDQPQSVAFQMGPSYTGSVQIPAGSCATSCTVHWAVDTTATFPSTDGGASSPVFPDGIEDISASLESDPGRLVGTDVQVVVDNHRPSLTVPGTYRSGVESASQQLAMQAAPQVSPTAPAGTTITDVQLEMPLWATSPVVHLTPPAPGASAWTADVDIADIPAGVYNGVLVAVDSNGVTSAPTGVSVEVDHGFTITPTLADAVGTNWAGLDLTYSYPEWASTDAHYYNTCSMEGSFARPEHINVLVDGTLWNSADVTSLLDVNGDCAVRAAGDTAAPAPLPAGRHQITYVVTDTDGVTQTVSAPMLIGALPLTTVMPVKQISTAVGGVIHVAPTVTAPDGFSKAASWSFSYLGTVIASGTYPTVPSLTWKTPSADAIEGPLQFTVVSDSGLSTSAETPVFTYFPNATFLHASATRVTKGTQVTLSPSIWYYAGSRWQAMQANNYRVTLQWQSPGSSIWHNGSSESVDLIMKAPAAFHDKVSSSVCLRAVTTYVDYEPFTTSASAPVCIAMKN
jgi:hypothetical protein